MNNRQQLLEEIANTSDEQIQALLDFLHQLKSAESKQRLAEFAGILSDIEAKEILEVISKECRQVDIHEW